MNDGRRQCPRSFHVSNLLRLLVSFGDSVDDVLLVFERSQPEIDLQFGRNGPTAWTDTFLARQLKWRKHDLKREVLQELEVR